MFGLFKNKSESQDRIKKTEEDIKNLENKIDEHVTELAENRYKASQEKHQAEIERLKNSDDTGGIDPKQLEKMDSFTRNVVRDSILENKVKSEAIENYKKEIHAEADAELSKIDEEVNKPYDPEKEEAEWQKRFEKIK